MYSMLDMTVVAMCAWAAGFVMAVAVVDMFWGDR